MYAIVDIETTGGSPVVEKITEIAIFVFDGEKIIDQFVTLINPEKNIPPYITGLTGISNEMVANSPKFFEVAKKILEITKNQIFVAHNVSFDYGFVKNEFHQLGYNFQRDILCTVKLSRKLIPGKKSYSLGNICSDLGIELNNRHRAAGDALATVSLFSKLLQVQKLEGHASFGKDDLGSLHPQLKKETIANLPDLCGVYYFHNERGNIIYIGKSKNIKARISNHLGSDKRTAMKLRKEIADITFELTGSELVALLLESAEIKAHKPLYNKTQRRTHDNSGIYSYLDEQGYFRFSVASLSIPTNDKTLLRAFGSREEAIVKLEHLSEEYNLCQKLCGLYNSQGSCFHYEIRHCKGACIDVEDAESYNLRALMAKHSIYQSGQSLIILDKGRHKDEKAVVRIKDGKYLGFGYIDTQMIVNVESIEECIKPAKDNHEVTQIIRSYLQKSKVEKIIHG